MTEVDVAVVGAGAAGLAAAKALQAMGRSVMVVEALGRIGGRAFTRDTDFGLPFDIGCAWIHAADRNPFFTEAHRLGWDMVHHHMGLNHLYFGTQKATPEELAAVEAAAEELQRRIDAHEGEDASLNALLCDCHMLRATSTFAGPMDFGKDTDEISIADFKTAACLDPNWYTRQGYGALIARWGADAPVTLDAPVRRIDWSGDGVALETDKGTLRARACIVTVSTGVLAFEQVRFHPALPETYLAAAHDLPMGLLTKIPLEVDGAEGLGVGEWDDLLMERHARHDLYFLCRPFGWPLMVGFVGGDFAWEMEAAGEAAAVDFVTDRLADIFGSDVRRRVRRSTMTNWAAERTIRGAYAAARPGQSGARDVLARPVGDRIWFAGEALAGPLIQTAGGARISGETVAHDVDALLPR
jgi:monoamine oxidase